MKMYETKFSFADETFLVRVDDKKVFQLMKAFTPEFESKKKPDLTIDFHFHRKNVDFNFVLLDLQKKALSSAIQQKNKNIVELKSIKGSKKKFVSGFINLKKNYAKIDINVKRVYFWGFFNFNFAKIVAIYLTNKKKGNIIHSSGILKGKKAVLFSAKDDGGKSTIMLLCPEAQYLGEDQNVLFFRKGKLFVQAYPFIGTLSNIAKDNAKAFELETLFFLKKAKKFSTAKLNRTQAIGKLLENDIQGTFRFSNIKTKERIELYEKISEKVSVFSLRFLIEAKLWKKIDSFLKKERI